MSSQESSGSSNASKLSLSLSQDTVEYLWNDVSTIAADTAIWSVLWSSVLLYWNCFHSIAAPNVKQRFLLVSTSLHVNSPHSLDSVLNIPVYVQAFSLEIISKEWCYSTLIEHSNIHTVYCKLRNTKRYVWVHKKTEKLLVRNWYSWLGICVLMLLVVMAYCRHLSLPFDTDR